MERILINELQKWKEKSDRKPLILRGARQVGKTWLLKDFGKKSFKDVCYINFEQKDVLGAIFEGTLSQNESSNSCRSTQEKRFCLKRL